ncbi:MAG: Cache 3/Cache 2 fusion domain-containing protein [Burkholderiaceae bacterium]|nr:Cache 3/Cache 2 fusion domain-containing protein [Burkholderiaceae bacterium]
MLHKLLNFRAWSLGAKLAMFTFLVMSVTLITLLQLVSYTMNQRATRMAMDDMREKTRLVVELLESFDQQLRSEANMLAGIIRSDMPGPLVLEANQQVDVAGAATPLLKAGDVPLNLNYALTDRFTEKTGAIATIFVKHGDDFVRVATSLKKEDGTRAVGTKLDHQHPAYPAIIAGQAYVGNATLFGQQYMTEYEPVKDAGGQVIAVLFIGRNFSAAVKQLKDRIRNLKLGETGYFYVLDAKPGKDQGTLVLHPNQEGKNIIDSKDARGRAFIQDMVTQQEGTITYPWINSERGETAPRDKVVAFLPMKSWDWVVAGGIYVDEYTTETNAATRYYALVAVALTLAMGGLIRWIMHVRLSLPLRVATNAAGLLASGDLTAHVDSGRDDEIGQLLTAINGIGAGLAQVVQHVRDSTTLIVDSSHDIARGNADLSGRTEAQASSLEQTAASMHELTGAVRQNFDSARHANDLALSASDSAARGRAVALQVSATMDNIQDSARRIVDIVSVIDGIAFQTNILALNAAVEAARAGEQGRGFAVVASEVRNLAQRSAVAAREIATLIGDSVAKVEAGGALTTAMAATMDDIVNAVTNVTGIMTEISAASREQTNGIEQVNQAVTQMDQMTQQNAAMVERASAAAQAMVAQADTLVAAVGEFKTGQTPARPHPELSVITNPSRQLRGPDSQSRKVA